MDTFFSHGLWQGVVAVAAFDRILACFMGSLIGTAVGVLPGLGPTATIAILLPITYAMDPLSAILMLCGIYYGVMYGGSITSVLMRVPGEVTSLMTCQDGYLIAKQGRPGYALAICAFASLGAGIVSTILVGLIGEPLARVSGSFGPPEYVVLVMGGLLLVTAVSQSSFTKSLIMAGLGLAISTIGTDMVYAASRFTGGQMFFADGINVAIIAMGIYGVAEAINLLSDKDSSAPDLPRRISGLYPSARELLRIAPATSRGTLIGFVVGLFPGAGATLSSFFAYGFEKTLDKTGRVGTGDERAVAAPEAANNAASQAAMVPLLSLGIPNNVITSMILGAFIIHGLTPGPMLVATRPDMFWGIVVGMFVANIFLIILNVPLVAVFVQLLRVNKKRLAIFVLVMCFIGAYSLRGQMGDCIMLAGFGAVGLALKAWSYDAAPLVLSLVLGQILEQSLQQSLIMGYGSPMIFFERPISLSVIAVTIAIAIGLTLLKRSGRVAMEAAD